MQGRYCTRKCRSINIHIVHKVRTESRKLVGGVSAWNFWLNCYNAAAPYSARLHRENTMSEEFSREGDGAADSIAATAIISLVVFTLYLWLSGMPS